MYYLVPVIMSWFGFMVILAISLSSIKNKAKYCIIKIKYVNKLRFLVVSLKDLGYFERIYPDLEVLCTGTNKYRLKLKSVQINIDSNLKNK